MDGLGDFVGVDRRPRRARGRSYTLLGARCCSRCSLRRYLQLEPRYRLADQVPDREQALQATGRLDQKLTGANPVHVMIEWKDGTSLFSPGPLEVIAKAHEALEKQAGLGNVWSLESLRRWLHGGRRRPHRDRAEVRRLSAGASRAALHRQGTERRAGDRPAAGRRLRAEILPVVEKIDRALDPVRQAHPDFRSR